MEDKKRNLKLCLHSISQIFHSEKTILQFVQIFVIKYLFPMFKCLQPSHYPCVCSSAVNTGFSIISWVMGHQICQEICLITLT